MECGELDLRSVLLLDFDNLWTALEKERPAAAKRFALDPQGWVAAIEDGSLIPLPEGEATRRRILSLRCYANPDLLFRLRCRTAFVRAGFSVVDCPSLTAAGKNSADIHMVLDAVDLLNHATRFDEFIILSADADFTPLLTRLRVHDRRTVVFSKSETACAYKAVATAQLRLDTLIAHLGSKAEPAAAVVVAPVATPAPTTRQRAASDRMVQAVRVALSAAGGSMPLARAAQLAHAEMKGETQNWGGAGGFLRMLTPHLGTDMVHDAKNQRLHHPVVPAVAVATSVPPPLRFDTLPEPFRDLALRLKSVLNCPVLPPADLRRVFQVTAEVFRNHDVFDADLLAKTVRGRIHASGRHLPRGSIHFILKGVQLAGVAPHNLRTPAALAAAYAISLVRTCQTEGVTLTPGEVGALAEWLGADAMPAPAPDIAA